MIFRTLPVAAAIAVIAVSSASAAQEAAGDKVNMVIVSGDDVCPEPAAGALTVCARKAENARYRIPEALPLADSPENKPSPHSIERHQRVDTFGTMACTT